MDLAYDVGSCHYSGRAHGTPTDSAAGAVTCHAQEQGVTLDLRGHWRIRPAGLPPVSGGVDTLPPSVLGTVPGSQAIVAGDTIRLQVGATDNFGPMWVGYRFSGSHEAADSLWVDGNQTQVTFDVPADSAWVNPPHTFTVFARDLVGWEATAPVTGLVVGIPPTLTATTTATNYFLNEPLRLVVHAADDQAVARIGYRILEFVGSGLEDSLSVSGSSVIDTLDLADVVIGSLAIEVFARDGLGLTVLDTAMVVVSSQYLLASGTTGDSLYGVGETLSLRVRAGAGDGALAWLGWRLGGGIGLADSVAGAPSGFDSLSVTLPIPVSWLGSIPVIAFARSKAGLLSEVPVRVVRVVQFTAHNSRPVTFLTRRADSSSTWPGTDSTWPCPRRQSLLSSVWAP